MFAMHLMGAERDAAEAVLLRRGMAAARRSGRADAARLAAADGALGAGGADHQHAAGHRRAGRRARVAGEPDRRDVRVRDALGGRGGSGARAARARPGGPRACASSLLELEAGRCLLRDHRGRVEAIQVEVVVPSLLRALLDDATAAREASRDQFARCAVGARRSCARSVRQALSSLPRHVSRPTAAPSRPGPRRARRLALRCVGVGGGRRAPEQAGSEGPGLPAGRDRPARRQRTRQPAVPRLAGRVRARAGRQVATARPRVSSRRPRRPATTASTCTSTPACSGSARAVC